jgi:hypothetical protein
VLNAAGQMIGVATAQVEKGQNLNFAIAVDHLRPLLDQHLKVTFPQFQAVVKRANSEHSKAANANSVSSSQNGQNEELPLTGQFGGVVHNRSAEVSAGFGIIVQDSYGSLSGCMVVKQPLFGSGPLAGYAIASDVHFTVPSAVGTITFDGHRRGAGVTGTYVVEKAGGSEEQGTFTLRKAKAEGPGSDFDTTRCPTDADAN